MIKKLFSVALVAGSLSANAQLTKLIDFDGAAKGNYPQGSLIQASDGMLYGMTQAGGASSNGVLFQYNPATNTYTKELDFAGTTNGSAPIGSLMQATDGMLYGMTGGGGVNTNCMGGCGTLFQYNPATNTLTKKIDFAGTTNGQWPSGDLMQASDGMLYGMTQYGGASNKGVLFQYNPATNTLTKKIDFAGTTNGSRPYGNLIQASDGMLYGMTYQGGANSDGVLFQYNPATNTYTDKIDFAGTTNGSNPRGSLIQASDGMLYGMTVNGGVNTYGVLFQYNPATNTYTKKFDFDGTTNGANPYGSLMQASDGMLYGMTFYYGANIVGTLFQYNPATSAYTKKLDFNNTNGANPEGSLIQASNGMLYGMTNQGGASTNCTGGCGVLFKYGGAAGIEQVSNSNEVSIYPNPASSSLQVTFSGNIQNKTLLITDMLGNTVKQSIIYNPTSIINIADLAEGVYFINIKTEQGTSTKKIIINK